MPGEQERAEEESQVPRPDDPLRALNTTVDSDRVRFEDPGGRGSEFVLDRAQAGVQLLVHKGQLGAQRPALCGKLLVNLLRDQLSEFLAELIAVHQHSISWGVSRAHAMPRRVLSLGAGRVLTHESLLRLWQQWQPSPDGSVLGDASECRRPTSTPNVGAVYDRPNQVRTRTYSGEL